MNGSKTPKAGEKHDRQDREEQESPDRAARILVETAPKEPEGEGLRYEEAQAMTTRHRLKKAKSKGFAKLERRIYNEYRKKGFGKMHARYIAKATAGKVARERRAK